MAPCASTEAWPEKGQGGVGPELAPLATLHQFQLQTEPIQQASRDNSSRRSSSSIYCEPTLPIVTIVELNRLAEVTLDPRYSIGKYALSSQSMLQQAKTYMQEGNLNRAYILYLRYTTLLLRELPQHPDYHRDESKKYISHMKKCCQFALDQLEKMKAFIEVRNAEYFRELGAVSPAPTSSASHLQLPPGAQHQNHHHAHASTAGPASHPPSNQSVSASSYTPEPSSASSFNHVPKPTESIPALPVRASMDEGTPYTADTGRPRAATVAIPAPPGKPKHDWSISHALGNLKMSTAKLTGKTKVKPAPAPAPMPAPTVSQPPPTAQPISPAPPTSVPLPARTASSSHHSVPLESQSYASIHSVPPNGNSQQAASYLRPVPPPPYSVGQDQGGSFHSDYPSASSVASPAAYVPSPQLEPTRPMPTPAAKSTYSYSKNQLASPDFRSRPAPQRPEPIPESRSYTVISPSSTPTAVVPANHNPHHQPYPSLNAQVPSPSAPGQHGSGSGSGSNYKPWPNSPFQEEFTTENPDFRAHFKKGYTNLPGGGRGVFMETSVNYNYNPAAGPAPRPPPKPAGMAGFNQYGVNGSQGSSDPWWGGPSPANYANDPKPFNPASFETPGRIHHHYHDYAPSSYGPSSYSASASFQADPSSGMNSNYTLHQPQMTTEGGEPLRTMHIPFDILGKFLAKARSNTDRNIETCGILCGTLKRNEFFLNTLLIPKQTATSDTCTTTNEEEIVAYQMEHDLLTLGWIHMLPEAIAIVCAPQHEPSYGIFRLTDPPGMGIISACRDKRTFHPHQSDDIYTEASEPGHVSLEHFDFKIVDMR
ncbi:hypothetical protein H4R33_002932 [Dimargaris cristalligena]|nr:hypothetical protein H4R33_002932 [Dimargaris cristalligena]